MVNPEISAPNSFEASFEKNRFQEEGAKIKAESREMLFRELISWEDVDPPTFEAAILQNARTAELELQLGLNQREADNPYNDL